MLIKIWDKGWKYIYIYSYVICRQENRYISPAFSYINTLWTQCCHPTFQVKWISHKNQMCTWEIFHPITVTFYNFWLQERNHKVQKGICHQKHNFGNVFCICKGFMLCSHGNICLIRQCNFGWEAFQSSGVDRNIETIIFSSDAKRYPTWHGALCFTQANTGGIIS